MSAIQKEVYNRRRRRNSANGLCYLIIKSSLKSRKTIFWLFIVQELTYMVTRN
jgi:hypothetical protein